jgi:hypothetical protein
VARLPVAKAIATEAAIETRPARQLTAKGDGRASAATRRRSAGLAVSRQPLPYRVAQGLDLRTLFRQCAVLREPALEFQRVRGIKLAVDIGVEQ